MHGKNISGAIVASALIAIVASGCGQSIEMERMDPTTDIQYDTKWSHKDNQIVADRMTESLLAGVWRDEFAAGNAGERPVLIVDEVRNHTSEHIDVKSLTDLIRTNLIKSQQVRFLSKEARDAILEEYKYQSSGTVDPSRSVTTGRQHGAQYIITGDISSVASSLNNKKVVTYKVTLNLNNLETAIIDWTDDHEILKKFKAKGKKL